MTRCRLCGALRRSSWTLGPLHFDYALGVEYGMDARGAALCCLSCALSNLDAVCFCVRPRVQAWLRRRISRSVAGHR